MRNDFALGWNKQVGWNWMNSHVRHLGADAPSHGDAVAGGYIGVRRIQVYFRSAARGQHDGLGDERLHLTRRFIEDVSPENPVFGGGTDGCRALA